jgi:GDPmannose 4,6-dehydratase
MVDRNALITGVTGQDGFYAAKELIKRGYVVYAMARYAARRNPDNIGDLYDHPRFNLVTGDLTDSQSIDAIFRSSPAFDLILNYAALSPVWRSWAEPEAYIDTNMAGVARMLEGMRRHCPEARFYQAGSSEQFGDVKQTPQNEDTPFNPRSPYAVTKVGAHWLVHTYRESYGLFAVNGISFNHESIRRGDDFVTQKIALAAARIEAGLQDSIKMGTLTTCRDWGHAPDYVDAALKMLSAPRPNDYVISTGETHSVAEFAHAMFERFNLDFDQYYEVDERFMRPAEVNRLRGCSKKIHKDLGWTATTKFDGLVDKMAIAAGKRAHKEKNA